MSLHRRLREAVSLDLPYADGRLDRWARAQQGLREAAVLALLHPQREELLYILRSSKLESHAGQIAFPGGMRDPEDPGSWEAAVREAEEELSIPKARLELVGALPVLPTITGFRVTPWLATLREPDLALELLPNPAEVETYFWAPLSDLCNPDLYSLERHESGGIRYETPVFRVGGHRIWGATAMMTRNLLDRLERVG